MGRCVEAKYGKNKKEEEKKKKKKKKTKKKKKNKTNKNTLFLFEKYAKIYNPEFRMNELSGRLNQNHLTPSEKESYLKEKNLLQFGANSFLFE